MKYLSVLSSKTTARARFRNFHVEASVKGDLKVCLGDHVSVTKMAALPIHVENHIKSLHQNQENI